MNVQVRLFARQRELAGTSRVTLDLPEGATIAQAWTALVVRYPALGPAGRYVRFARNRAYADEGERLDQGDELACIPPVAGGAGDAAGVPGDAAGVPGDAAGAPGGIADGPVGAAHPDPARPASSGAAGQPGRVRLLSLTDDPIGDEVLADLRGAVVSPADGAVVIFEGRTRETPGIPGPGEEAAASRFAGERVRALEYEAYEEMARGVLGAIAEEIEARFGVRRLAIVHRTGLVPLGDVSVAIAVAAPHRAAAFDACRYAIDELKARAPIWKAEQFEDGRIWIGRPARATPER
ncbi:MAG: molybdenum cofactor biosynthesis protein MoaE [Candidatus Limnocylindrales bacterium]